MKFLWRYNATIPTVRGMDDSISEPSVLEAQHAREAFEEARLNLHLYNPAAPLVKFKVYGEDKRVAYYIGSKPTVKENVSLTGRSTRVFAVYALDMENIVFLKDTWRIDVDGIDKESTIYKILHEANIPHIAPLVRGEDIPGQYQRTLSQKFAEKFAPHRALGASSAMRPHQHYRIVLGIIAQKLTSFLSSHVLVTSMRDAIEGTILIFRCMMTYLAFT
jgi:hypothetical protein